MTSPTRHIHVLLKIWPRLGSHETKHNPNKYIHNKYIYMTSPAIRIHLHFLSLVRCW